MEAVQKAANEVGVDLLNTRCVCSSAAGASRISSMFSVRKNGPSDFTILVASANTKAPDVHSLTLPSGTAKLTVEYGDFSEPLSKAIASLKEAKKYAANDHQTAMIDGYIESYAFHTRSSTP